jgi:hypothetical protein
MENFTLFGQIGRALFGSHWQSDLARTLDVNPRTVRRWGAGQEEPPSGVWRELEDIAVERSAELERLILQTRALALRNAVTKSLVEASAATATGTRRLGHP